MNTLPTRPTIKDLDLDDSDQITLHLELIRIIEKDIDDIQEANTREGWTSWALIGGIVSALFLLFGETRNLQQFPTQAVGELFLAGTLFMQIVFGGLRLFNREGAALKPGRIRWSNEEGNFYPPAVIYRILILIICSIIAAVLTLPLAHKILTFATFGYWLLMMIVVFALALSRRPIGRPNLKNPGALIITVPFFLLTIAALIMLALRQSPPVGSAGLPYILAGLLLAIVWLAEFLMYSTMPSRLLSNLKDLKNDIVFGRVDIDEALKRYETLAEGETLPDAVQKELSAVLDEMGVVSLEQSLMAQLMSRMIETIPAADDNAETVERKINQIRLDRTSYQLHVERYNNIAKGLGGMLSQLGKSMNAAQAASADSASANQIEATLKQRLDSLTSNENILNGLVVSIDAYLNNPRQVPPALREAIDNIRREREASNTELKPSPPDAEE